jgi:hypothetical protein
MSVNGAVVRIAMIMREAGYSVEERTR